MTTTDYFYLNLEQLPLVKITNKKYTLHDSCHISRKFRKSEVPRKLLSQMGNYIEMENHHDESMCCYYYNFEYDSKNSENRQNRIQEAGKVADIMVTDCVTCLEVYRDKVKEKSVEIRDFNEMVYHCIQMKEGKDSDLLQLSETEENAVE
ncbi:MAG: heterodisulfide reductase-related iron-sulfur binding cluster [Promethearchaeota archaeon]